MKDILFQKFVTSCSKIHFQQHMWFCTGCQKPLLLIVQVPETFVAHCTGCQKPLLFIVLDGCTGFVTIKFMFIFVGRTGVQEKIIQSQSSHLDVGTVPINPVTM
jgi:predicted amidophosphoribosyltransferase